MNRDILTNTALKQALEKGSPTIHPSDQWVQDAANDYANLLKHHDVELSMAEVGQASQNGYSERLVRTIQGKE